METFAPNPYAVTVPTTPTHARQLAVAEYRRKNPRSRVIDVFAFDLNTSRRQSKVCVLTGETGPTWCSQWPKTRTAWAWEIEVAHRLFGREISCRD